MPDRSLSLPLCGGSKSKCALWKEKCLLHTKEKHREIEVDICVSVLCFKTDLMTVQQRRDIMERQKDMADLNYEKEISYFSSLMSNLRYVWQDKEVSEVLSRLTCQVLELGDKGRKLAKEADSLGSLRQEQSYMKTVLVMLEYVELLTEKNSDVHKQLVNARKVLVDNNIAIEKPVKVDPEMATKTRSVSLVSSAPSAVKRVFYHQEERSKSVTEREILENNNEVRKRRSMFATINEIGDTPTHITEGTAQDHWRKTRKPSKKVSIAENLNCDYSDTDISDHECNDQNTVDISDEIRHILSFEKVSELLQVLRHRINIFLCVKILILLVLSQYYS